MTMMLNIDDRYIAKLESFIASLPDGVVQIKNSLDDEIFKRITEYKSGEMKTTPFGTQLDKMRDRLSSQL